MPTFTLPPAGHYRYWLNGAPIEVREHWVSAPLPSGQWQVRATRHAPAFGSTLTVEALMTGADIEAFEVRWHNTTPGAVTQASAHYRLTADLIHVSRVVAGAPQPDITLARPAQLVVAPLLRVFQGPAIQRLAAWFPQGMGPTLAPWIEDPREAGRLLTPVIDQRGARDMGAESVLVDGQPVAVRRYAYVTGRYTDKAVFYLTAEGVLARYTFAESADRVWDVQLTQA